MANLGGKSKQERDHSDAVIDPALRDLPSPARTDKSGQDSSGDHPSMPIRVEQPFQMSSPRRQHHHFENSARAPSPPPPIATMPNSHSPSPSAVSVDRSSNSTPHIRRSPPLGAMQPPPAAAPMYYQHHDQHVRHFNTRGDLITPHHTGYIYAPPNHAPFDPQPRYDHHHQHPPQQQHHPHHPDPAYGHPSGLPTHFSVPTMQHPSHNPNPSYGRGYPLPGQAPVTIVHTDDAATKLTDGIRRRCFNCCTTDTSTWRRSNLSPGKVLCNKCGLFERTHSRPRPDQFPHKRGPLASSTLRGRTPPGGAGPGSGNQLPPISSAAPYQYHHGSMPPLSAGDYHGHANTLPGLQSWHGNNSGSSSGASSGVGNLNGSASNGNLSIKGEGTSTPPLLSRRSTQESPRIHSNAIQRGSGRVFDEPLSSNAADHSHSHPPSPPMSMSRSSTSNGHQQGSHTPPPARDPPA